MKYHKNGRVVELNHPIDILNYRNAGWEELPGEPEEPTPATARPSTIPTPAETDTGVKPSKLAERIA